jgi:outer membrane protein assembly factor BamB
MPWLRSLLLVAVCSPLAGAADWPQWLGPNRDATSKETVAPWKEAPKVLWRQPVGEGHSSPVVAGGKVFLHAKVKDKDEEEVIALDAKTGEPAWRMAYPRAAFKSLFGNGPRATPTVAGDHAYTFGITGVLSCFEAASGKQLWQVDTLKKFNAKNLYFGASCSPLLADNRVLVNVGGKGASVVAFDKDKGDVAWKSLDDAASYSSPILTELEGAHQAVFLTGQGVVSLNPADGSLLWKYGLVDALSESATTPVRAGNLILAGTITIGTAGLGVAKEGEKLKVEEAWKNPDLTCYFSTPVPVGQEHVYLVTGSKPLTTLEPEATLRCVEAKTGKELWHKAKVGKYHASLLRTGNEKLLMLDDAGNLILLDPNPKEYRELARSRVCGMTWAHPALADGRLYVRDAGAIICLQLSE